MEKEYVEIEWQDIIDGQKEKYPYTAVVVDNKWVWADMSHLSKEEFDEFIERTWRPQ